MTGLPEGDQKAGNKMKRIEKSLVIALSLAVLALLPWIVLEHNENNKLQAEITTLKQENAGLRNYTASAVSFANERGLSSDDVALMVLAFGQSESCSVLGDSCAGVLADDGMDTVPFVTQARLGNLWFSIVSANQMGNGRIEPRLTVYYDDRQSDHILRTAGDGWVEVIGGGTITRRKIPGEVEKIHRLALAALRS